MAAPKFDSVKMITRIMNQKRKHSCRHGEWFVFISIRNGRTALVAEKLAPFCGVYESWHLYLMANHDTHSWDPCGVWHERPLDI